MGGGAAGDPPRAKPMLTFRPPQRPGSSHSKAPGSIALPGRLSGPGVGWGGEGRPCPGRRAPDVRAGGGQDVGLHRDLLAVEHQVGVAEAALLAEGAERAQEPRRVLRVRHGAGGAAVAPAQRGSSRHPERPSLSPLRAAVAALVLARPSPSLARPPAALCPLRSRLSHHTCPAPAPALTTSPCARPRLRPPPRRPALVRSARAQRRRWPPPFSVVAARAP